VSENGSRDKYLLKRVESIMTREVKLLEDILSGENKIIMSE